MKSRIRLGIVLLLMIAAPLSAQTPVGTAFTYQGQLKSGGTPYTGTADFQFTLYDVESSGDRVAGPIAVTGVSVVNGLFTTAIDFGRNAFSDEARWLEIAVRAPAGSGSFTTLSPRQAITATPYALKVPGIDGHSLDAQDGSPVDALFVNNSGLVGIGTTWPAHRLHVESSQQGAAVYASNTATSGDAYGFYAECSSPAGAGVYGHASSTSGTAAGVHGRSDSTAGYGVIGEARDLNTAGTGVFGHTMSSSGTGVLGIAWSASGDSEGVGGISHATNGYGVSGLASGSGANCGVFGESSSGAGRGVYGIARTEGGIAGYFESGPANTAPALKTIGDAVVQAQNWPGGGTESRLYLGDGNHYIKAAAGQGVRIGTFGAPDLIRLQEGTGLVGIGRTPTAYKLEVEGDASKSTAGSWWANSDARIKTNVQTVTGALDALDRVRLVRFRYSDDYRCEHPDVADRQYVNVVAQEFAEVFPDYVRASGDPQPDGSSTLQVDSYPLTVYSAAAVQELHAMVKEKDAQIAAQQAEIAAMREQDTRLAARVAALEQLVEKLAKVESGDEK